MKAITVAKYYLSKDPEKKLFNDKIVNLKNGRHAYEGNIRLNKYLFLTQVVYLAKYGKRLFEDDFLAYENGPIIKDIQQSYGRLNSKENEQIKEDIIIFLDKIYMSLENATYEELIDITHEDPEWIRLKEKTYNAPTMNLEKNINEYKKRYKGLIEALNI